MVSAYIRGLNYDSLYHEYYPKHYVQFDGIWIDFNMSNSIIVAYQPTYSDYKFNLDTPVMIQQQFMQQQPFIIRNSNDITSDSEDDDDDVNSGDDSSVEMNNEL